MFFVYNTSQACSFSGWKEEDVCRGNFWEVIEIDSEAALHDFEWETRCNDASSWDQDEDEDVDSDEAWNDHVYQNSHFSYFLYDPSNPEHVELSGCEKDRPEHAAAVIKEMAAEKQRKINSYWNRLGAVNKEIDELLDQKCVIVATLKDLENEKIS